MTGEILEPEVCWFCGNSLRRFFLLEDIACEVCDVCIAPFLPFFDGSLARRRNK